MMMARPKGKPRQMRDIRKAIEMYIGGTRMRDIAAKFHVTQPTVTYWCKRHGETMFPGKYMTAVRKQGRRAEAEPNDRDKDIIFKAAAGVPVIKQAKDLNISRARASFIVKTWIERGYTPPMMFSAGQTITDGKNKYLIVTADWQHGKVVQTHNEHGKIEPIEHEEFRWYRGGELCKVVE